MVARYFPKNGVFQEIYQSWEFKYFDASFTEAYFHQTKSD